jgi:phosphomannomutase
MSKTGHAFMKETMRAEDAAYGGEMSAHHYFRDFAYCDSGMVPWLLISKLISETGQSLAQLVDERMQAFPASGEINRRVDDAEAVIADISERFLPEAVSTDHTDGLSLEFNDWRFNLRRSNTEPVIRLNVESRGLPDLMEEKTALLLDLVGGAPA